MSDFFESHQGLVHGAGRRRPRISGRVRDAAHDLGLTLSGGRGKAAAIAAATPRRKILALGVGHPDRPGDLEAIMGKLAASRHEVTVSIVEMQPGLGKFQNITRALAKVGRPPTDFDWVVITDDDIGMPAHFLDEFIGLAEHAGFLIAQPAHRFHSYTTFLLTQRRWGSLARSTRWVEIGPFTALRRDVLADLIPFPVQRWDFGLDVYWAQLADQKGWRIGVIDGVAVEHLRPVAGGYDPKTAIAEATEFLASRNVTFSRAATQQDGPVITSWWPQAAPTAQPRRPPVTHPGSSGASS